MIWGKGLEHITDCGIPPGAGNMAIALKLCRNVLIRDITILHGGPALRLTQTENISIYGSLGMENMKFKKLALKEL